MADFNVLKDYPLAVGGALQDEADVAQLRSAGVGAVIDCRAEFDDGPLLAASGWPYLWDPRDDNGQGGPAYDLWWSTGIQFAGAQLRLLMRPIPTSSRLYVHCAAGVNRGPSMAYGILRFYFGLAAQQAEAVIRAARPQVGLAYMADFERWFGGTSHAGPN